MDSIFVVGGIKSEPSIIKSEPPSEYVPPSSDGTAVEITFSDIDSENESIKVNGVQPSASHSVSEHLTISDDQDATKDEKPDVFRYVGLDSGKSNEEVDFNFTKNEDLYSHIGEDKQLQDSSETAINNNPEIDPSKLQYIYLPQSKIDLNMYLFSENLFSGEYQNTDNCYRCAHCDSREYTKKKIRAHIIEHHRQTELKQCPHCDVKTKVLQYHLKISHPGSDNRSKSAQQLPETEKQRVQSKNSSSPKNILQAALFSEDLSSGEYRLYKGACRCLHCDFRGSLGNIKNHITTTHRRTEAKRCLLCNAMTKVLVYHLRTVHNCTLKQAPSLLAEFLKVKASMQAELEKTSKEAVTTPIIRLDKKRKSKLDLNMALYSEDFSHLEYMKRNAHSFRCLHCDHVDTHENIKVHITENHRKTKLKQCPFCDAQTRVLKYHLRTHATPLEYKCKECNYETINTSKLNRHIREHHEDIFMKQCDICHKIYPSKRRLVEHIRCYHTDTMLTCKFCSYTTKYRECMNDHIEKHKDLDELKTFKCDKCNFKTKYKKKFSMHKSQRHKLFVCDQCGTKVCSRISLKLHMLLHKEKLEDEDLPYRCDKCNYKTSRHYNLVIHNLKHKKPSEKQYFYCYHCDFKANRKDNLKTHIFKHFQKEEVTFQCFICDFTATKKHVLIRHIDKHAGTK